MTPIRHGLPGLAGALFLLTGLGLTAERASGQTSISARSSMLRIGGRLHFQMASSSAEGRTTPEFFVRRARLVVDVEINDFLDGRVQPAFVTGKVLLQDAYFRLRFTPAFRLYFGQFKQAFDLFELASSTEFNMVERAGEIPGISACPGVAGICSYGRFAARLLYGGRDTGIRADGNFGGGRWSYAATVTNGEGIFENADTNGRKSAAARLTFRPASTWEVGASVNFHDYAVDRGDEEINRTASAWNVDVQWGRYRAGWMVQAGLLGGDNWKSLDDQDRPTTLFAAQGIGSYYHRLGAGSRIEAIEPALRLSYGDPDTDRGGDGSGVLVTPGFNVYVLGRNRINANLDLWVPDEDDAEWTLRAMTYLYF